jgi:hypothetical protein
MRSATSTVGEAARADVEDVDEAHEAAVDHERQRELTRELASGPGVPLARRESGIVRARHDEDLMVADHRPALPDAGA